MAFHHVPTFLRSALVRNPFCHGDIISAEDVLRLEAQYPNLFDNPHKLNVPGETTKDEPKTDCKSQKQLESKHIETKSRPFLRNQKAVKSLGLSTANKKSSPSQYHRNCLSSGIGGGEEKDIIIPRKRINVPPKPFHALPAPNFASMRNRKLTRPAQSFSMEDLRQTLREVMRDDALYSKQTRNPSPYTEDLVKKFLGRKLQSEHSQKRGIPSNGIKGQFKLTGFSGDDSDVNGHGDLGGTTKFELNNRESNNYPARETSNPYLCKPLVRSSKEKVKRVKSAPGFIRSFPQPKTVYQKGRDSPLKKRDEKKQVKWKEGSKEKGISTGGIRQNNTEESPERLTRKSSSSTADMHENSLEPKGTRAQIHIRSLKLSQETEEQTESHKPNLPSSSFRHLLAARSVTSRYKMKGLLRKQNAESCETNDEQRPAIPGREHKYVSIEMKKASHASTTHALERIAKELVYTEILQQLHELKQQQTKAERTEKEKHDDTHSISFSSPLAESKRSPLNFVPTSADERKSESLELPKSNESLVATLKTPELTPPSVPKAKLDDKDKKSSVSLNNISLHTPELSPSLRKIIATKKAQMSKQTSHPNLDTDCSEISDFVASEIEKCEKSGNHPESNKSGRESLILVTPQLSKSSVVNKNRPSKTFKPSQKPSKIEIPEFDASTLSGVSTFKDSNHSSARENRKSLDENGAKIVSHKEEEQVEVPPVKDMNGGSQKGETSGKADQQENFNENSTHQSTYSAEYLSESLSVQEAEPDMNVSGATVIDLLSEGEFIGAAYRSPGELSLRQRSHCRSSSRKAFENFSVSNSGLEDSKNDGESDLSFISSGFQVCIIVHVRIINRSYYCSATS
ncbi:unnamed protein product [Orchesella dallaii]|uniref:Uncharacterized protein n=1 Tax=Orchesella dallaii TaxID=48710 RepID=A0ABP1QHY5_9HEXA